MWKGRERKRERGGGEVDEQPAKSETVVAAAAAAAAGGELLSVVLGDAVMQMNRAKCVNTFGAANTCEGSRRCEQILGARYKMIRQMRALATDLFSISTTLPSGSPGMDGKWEKIANDLQAGLVGRDLFGVD